VDARIIRKTALMREGKWKILRGCCPWLKRQVMENEWDEKNPGKPKDGNDHAVEASGYAELANLGAAIPLQADLDTVPGESREVAALWKDFRRTMREREEARFTRQMDRILDDDPYDVDDGTVHYIEAR
jgi:type II secretory pathway component PulL